jgi:hypothetical protein
LPLTQTVGWLPCQQENRIKEKITARMKWIVKILETHSDAVIKHYRDWFWEKSLYALEWTENGSCYQSYVTTKMRQQLFAQD